MSLRPGTRLGSYEILGLLGAGGMGEVYKARDTRLDRLVALKVIQPAAASSPEMRERFEREARAISALDHPHICTLYDVCREAETSFLVMQYLEGESLADRLARSSKPPSDPAKPPSGDTSITTIAKGPIPFDTALRYAAEIAHALDAAHRRGIVHRDLKPGNVMLTKTGTKLLDFGLAKLAADGDKAGIFGDATRTSPLTSQGAILGTLHYMAPEQLEGRDVDARSDIHAFGALFYEMLSGRRAFDGQSQAGIIAAIVGGDPPPLAALADPKVALPVVPRRALDRLLARCLEKNPDDRWQSAADLAAELKWIGEERQRAAPDVAMPAAATAPSSRTRERLWIGVAGALAIALATLAYVWYPRPAPRPAPVTFTIAPPDGQTLAIGPGLLAFSPDGGKVAFVTGQSPTSQLWVRSLDSLTPVRIDRADGAWHPVWSPDGRAIAYTSSGGRAPLRRVDIAAGVARQLAPESFGRVGWSRSGVILFTGAESKLYRVPENGGPITAAMELDPSRKETSLEWPLFLPDGQRYLFLARSADPANTGLFLASLDSPDRTWLMHVLSSVEYAHGHLFYQRDGTLMARPFDAGAGRLTGDEFPVVEQVVFNAGNGRMATAVSGTGAMAYVGGAAVNLAEGRTLLIADRNGTAVRTIGPGKYASAVISPDGRQAVIGQDDGQPPVRRLYLLDLERSVLTRFTIGDGDERNAVWAPNGSSIVFQARRDRASGIYRRGAGGGATTDELLWQTDEIVAPSGFSSDGQRLLFTRGSGASQVIWILPLTGDRTPIQAFPGSTVAQLWAKFSPDDKWIAYQEGPSPSPSDNQIYVQPSPPDGRRVQISTTGGRNPTWSYDGREIMYRAADDSIMTVALTFDGGTIRPSTPRPLFPKPLPGNVGLSYTGDARAERLLLIRPPEKPVDDVATITVIVNFAQSVAKK